MSHTCHSKLQKTALRRTESDDLRLCRHASMTHQLAAKNALRALELAAVYGTANMISRSTLLRALALCDAAKVRLPILEVNLARGLVAAHQPASELCRKDCICSTPGDDPFSTLQGDVMLTSSGYSSTTRSRQLSSEAAFREYGRNFGDESRMSEGTAVPNDQFVAESIPEGLHEDVEDMDGEQQESEDEAELRQQLLKAALTHVVGLMCQPNWFIQHFWSCGSCEKCMAWHVPNTSQHPEPAAEGARLVCGCTASRGQRPGPLQSRIRDGTRWRSRPSGGVLLTHRLLLTQHVVMHSP